MKAIAEWTPQTTKGDVNADGQCNIADIVLLQKWLITIPNTELVNWENGDLDSSGQLNAADLSLMKELLLK